MSIWNCNNELQDSLKEGTPLRIDNVLVQKYIERERERERERETDRETERQRERQTERQRDRERQRDTLTFICYVLVIMKVDCS